MLPMLLRVIGVLLLVPGLAWNQMGLSQWLDSSYKVYAFGMGFACYLAGALMSQFQRMSKANARGRRDSDSEDL